jgi:hypothetical protein
VDEIQKMFWPKQFFSSIVRWQLHM